MSSPKLKRVAAARIGLEYQDLVGIEVLIRFFRDPHSYSWVEVESQDPDVGFLDDIVVARSNGSFEYTQVKFTADPDAYFLSWDWLLESSAKGTSRLHKWATSLSKVATQGRVQVAQLRTNRRPDPEVQSALRGTRVHVARLTPARRRQVERELGGAEAASAFFKRFSFAHSEHADADAFETHLRSSVVPTDTTSEGWLLLRQQVRRWATRKNQPEPDGKIRHQHLVQIITKSLPRPIPQNFVVPRGYALPNRQFHADFQRRISSPSAGVTVLWGTPGKGKSTYLSYLLRDLTKRRVPTIRHHYFLSLDDSTSDRISFTEIAGSLKHQIVSRYPEAVRGKGLDENPNSLRDWITACGTHFLATGKQFLVVIDGLDHVWRERLNIEQMNHLFNHLLPCPKGVALVVGTQRVIDDQLPSRLLVHARRTDWREIPAMDEKAVHEWFADQSKAGRVRLPSGRSSKAMRAKVLKEIGAALFSISRGHPLHLIYSFETLVRRGVSITPEEVRRLPPCPDGDIRKYYASLWSRLRAQGKQVVHLIAAADFRWPPEGLRRCAGSIDEIDHLLEHRRTGVVPFHGSLLAFAKEQPGHTATFRALLPKVVRWLERDAPDYWRWGWLWITKAELRSDSALLTKTTRRWVVDSMVAGWPAAQIVAILRAAQERAFAKADYCRAIELRSLLTRVQNGPEHQLSRYAEFVEAAIRASDNRQQLRNMADDLGVLEDAQIVAVSRALPEGFSPDIGNECVEELRRRINLWIELRHRPNDEFVTLARRFLEVLARHGQFVADRVIRFISQFSDRDSVFGSCLASLQMAGNLQALIELSSELSWSSQQTWRTWTEHAAVRVAAFDGANVEGLLAASNEASPLLCASVAMNGRSCPRLRGVAYDPQLFSRERYEYGLNTGLKDVFHDVFFSALVLRRISAGPFSDVLPGIDERRIGWAATAFRTLREAATDIANGLVKPTFSSVFVAMARVPPRTFEGSGDALYTQYIAFKAALRQIATDLFLIAREMDATALVGPTDFAVARSSKHWDDDAWLAANIENQMPLLAVPTAKAFLAELERKATGSVTEFNERAERWIELALFALLYGLRGSKSSITRAASCIVGYGFHKDTYVYEVVDSVHQLHRFGVKNVRPLIKRLAPIVDQLKEFTDNDELRGAPFDLVDLIAEAMPSRLPAVYSDYIANDRWELAEHVLEAHLKVLRIDDDVEVGLARTLLSRTELAILDQLARKGHAGAGSVLATQAAFLGDVATPPKTERSDSETFGRKGRPPDVTKFAPTAFGDLVKRVSRVGLGYEHRDETLVRWIRYWKDRKKGRQALASIEGYFRDNELTYSVESILDEAFHVSLEIEGRKAAYRWLVMAHTHRHGWQAFWTSEEEVMRRLRRAAELYPSKWQTYIQDTSKPTRYWEREGRSFAIGLRYLVRYLLLVGQGALAAKYTETLLKILVDEVSDQPIGSVSWMN